MLFSLSFLIGVALHHVYSFFIEFFVHLNLPEIAATSIIDRRLSGKQETYETPFFIDAFFCTAVMRFLFF